MSLSYQSKENLKSLMNRLPPKLKHLFLMNTDFGGNIEDYVSISELNLDLIYIYHCAYKPDDPIWSVLLRSAKLINSMHIGKIQCYHFDILINGHVTKIAYNYGLSFVVPNSPNLVHGLILSPEQTCPGDSPLDNISFITLFPSKIGSPEALSTQSKQALRSIMSCRCPNLKYLLLDGLDLNDCLEDYIPISELSLDLIYIHNCTYETKDPIWTILFGSAKVVNSMYTVKIQGSQFDILINGHTTQFVCNYDPSLVVPNSPNLVRGLIFPLGQELPNNLLLDSFSFLALPPSKSGAFTTLSSQSKQNLKSLMNRLPPKLRRLFLMHTNFDDNIEDFIPISQMNLDSIYLWNCSFGTSDPVWLTLYISPTRLNLMNIGKIQSYQFDILINGHITQIVCSYDPSFVIPNSPNLIYGLILPLEQELPSNLLLDSFSFLALPPSKSGAFTTLSSQSKQSLKSLMNRLPPKLRRLLLIHTDFDGNIEDYVSISQPRCDLIYISNCSFATNDPIWSIFTRSVELVGSLHPGKVMGFQFDIPVNGHTTQIVFNANLSFSMLNSSDLGYGLIFFLEQELSNNILFDNISFLALSSKMDLSEIPSPQYKQNLKFIMNRSHPKLTHLLLKNINFNGNIEDFISISQPRLNLIYIWGYAFKTNNLIWSSLYDSMRLLSSRHVGKIRGYQFIIPINEQTIRIVFNVDRSFLIPNSPDLVHGLVLHLGQNLPNDFLSNNFSFLIFLPSEADSSMPVSFQLEQSLKSIKNRCPELKHVFLKGLSISDVQVTVSLGPLQFKELEVSTL